MENKHELLYITYPKNNLDYLESEIIEYSKEYEFIGIVSKFNSTIDTKEGYEVKAKCIVFLAKKIQEGSPDKRLDDVIEKLDHITKRLYLIDDYIKNYQRLDKLASGPSGPSESPGTFNDHKCDFCHEPIGLRKERRNNKDESFCSSICYQRAYYAEHHPKKKEEDPTPEDKEEE
jgi:hypothetical protein